MHGTQVFPAPLHKAKKMYLTATSWIEAICANNRITQFNFMQWVWRKYHLNFLSVGWTSSIMLPLSHSLFLKLFSFRILRKMLEKIGGSWRQKGSLTEQLHFNFITYANFVGDPLYWKPISFRIRIRKNSEGNLHPVRMSLKISGLPNIAQKKTEKQLNWSWSK